MLEWPGARIPRRTSPLYCKDWNNCLSSVLFFTSLLAVPLARQRFFYALTLARFQVKGMTLYFLDDVFLLYLAFKPAQCVFKRLAFLYANLCQC